MVKKQIIPWLCLIISAQAIAFIACQSSTSKPKASKPAIDPIKGGFSTGMNFNDNKQSDQKHANKRGMEVAVVHDRKGAYGGSVLTKPRKNKSAASSLPVALAHIILSVCVVVTYMFLY
ncbi:hypothetical protein CDL12_09701 [Handroanthus impetiginosus]|uniref:Uncharacterized protein n=1 Tax=Handroanthus impetiginosus TaxID=429701 RepID=A0A2G9HJF8_9LAMI|nr:hypothetical protein CDL12_09701 [Handroanthus impetiginosus]